MLGVWRGVQYVKKLCQACDLGRVEDEEHLLLVYPNTYEHGHPSQVCGMLLVPKDNLSSMISLSSNGLCGPKQM